MPPGPGAAGAGAVAGVPAAAPAGQDRLPAYRAQQPRQCLNVTGDPRLCGQQPDTDDPLAGLPVAVGQGTADVRAVPPPGRPGPGKPGTAHRAHP